MEYGVFNTDLLYSCANFAVKIAENILFGPPCRSTVTKLDVESST